MIIGLSCNNPELRYALTNYVYVRRANVAPELLELNEGKFRCWLSEAGHFVMPLEDGKAVAVNLNGYKHPLISQYIFPLVRAYSFYDVIKYLAERLYGAPYEKLYSVNVDKEKYSKVLTYKGWLDDLASSLKRYDDKALYNAVFRTIEEDGPELALITDVTTPEDVRAVQGKGGKVVHILTEKLYGGKKKDLDLTIYDAIVDAREAKQESIYESLKDVFDSFGYPI